MLTFPGPFSFAPAKHAAPFQSMLTQKGKYAIKALIFLAKRGTLVRTQEIATGARVPRKFLEAILLELKSHGVVRSTQGAQGGYSLAKPADTITLAELYRLFEGPIALVGCASEKSYQPCADCFDVTACSIRFAMLDIRNEAYQALEAISIQKLADAEKEGGAVEA